jgi:sigma-E factor negative regulatory protein RseC
MLRETGRVVAVEADAVWVETIPSSLCGKCAARAGCGQGIVSRASGVRGLVRALESGQVAARDCRVDDEVDIDLPESAILRGSAWVYGIPLLAGILLSLSLEGVSEPMAVVGFLLGLGGGFLVVRLTQNYLSRSHVFEPLLAARRPSTSVIIRS